jgi:hypothetical protein
LRWIELLCRYGERYNNIWRGGGRRLKKKERKKSKETKNKNMKIIVNDRLDSLLRPLLIGEPSLLRKCSCPYTTLPSIENGACG